MFYTVLPAIYPPALTSWLQRSWLALISHPTDDKLAQMHVVLCFTLYALHCYMLYCSYFWPTVCSFVNFHSLVCLYVPICTNQAVHVKLIINKYDDDDDEVLQAPLSHPRVLWCCLLSCDTMSTSVQCKHTDKATVDSRFSPQSLGLPSVLWWCWLGIRKGIQPVKNWVVDAGMSEVQTCIWPSWCHCHSLSLASVKSRLVYLSGTGSSG